MLSKHFGKRKLSLANFFSDKSWEFYTTREKKTLLRNSLVSFILLHFVTFYLEIEHSILIFCILLALRAFHLIPQFQPCFWFLLSEECNVHSEVFFTFHSIPFCFSDSDSATFCFFRIPFIPFCLVAFHSIPFCFLTCFFSFGMFFYILPYIRNVVWTALSQKPMVSKPYIFAKF